MSNAYVIKKVPLCDWTASTEYAAAIEIVSVPVEAVGANYAFVAFRDPSMAGELRSAKRVV